MASLFSPARRLAAAYAATFVTFGIHGPFFPIFLAGRGLTEAEIAIILAVPMLMRVGTAPLLGFISDLATERRTVVAAYAFGAAIAFSAFGTATTFAAMVGLMILTALPWNGVTPGLDTISLSMVRRGLVDYGAVRVWGSLGYVAANVAGGILFARTGAEAVFLVLAGAFWLQATMILAAPAAGPRLAVPAEAGKGPSGFADLLRSGPLMAVLVGIALVQSSHALQNGFASLYWRSIGFGEAFIGTLWALGVSLEVFLFFLGTRLTARLGPHGLLILGGCGALARWALYPVIEGRWAWAAVQVLHAFSFSATHLGTMVYIARAAPDRLTGSAQGIAVTLTGLVMAIAMLSSGPLYGWLGVQGFWVMAGLAAAGTAILVWQALRAQPQRSGVGGRSVEPS
ncbi:MFS transporter [Prosthecomicrobium sp. N25]|uniref:MFS transporter n=1 Tax=Prosthecomicrobium sp. N25 TaxID=3129254 RepID=UPI003076A603